tara:strand:- start:4029 stop:4787 length:759 start_codon:yes stop_codon:yes gene_type:complete
MKIKTRGKELVEALELVSLKGKYHNGLTAKNGQLSNFAYAEIDDDMLFIYNADHSTVCKIGVDLIEHESTKMNSVVFDIDKTTKYLKPFGDDETTLVVGDYITLESETTKAKIPKVLEHPGIAAIMRLKEFTMPSDDNILPTFGKTTFESSVTVLADDLSNASKACDAVNNAKFKFDTSDDTFVISSERNNLDKIEIIVDTLEQEGECATVEFCGTFHKFMKNGVSIYMKDDAPILFVSRNRMLLKAPYLER